MNKNNVAKLIGVILIFISLSSLIGIKNFQIGLELLWFLLGLMWLFSGLIMKKKSSYHLLDRPIYYLLMLYLLGVSYLILLRPTSWTKTIRPFGFQINHIDLLITSIFLSILALISHFSIKRSKTRKLTRH